MCGQTVLLRDQNAGFPPLLCRLVLLQDNLDLLSPTYEKQHQTKRSTTLSACPFHASVHCLICEAVRRTGNVLKHESCSCLFDRPQNPFSIQRESHLVEVSVALYELWTEGIVLLSGVQLVADEQVPFGKHPKLGPHRHEVRKSGLCLQDVARQNLQPCDVTSLP